MKRNTNYGTLNQDGTIEYAPIPLNINGVDTWTNQRLDYIGEGYCDIVRTEQPEEEGYYYTSAWEQTNSFTITETWTKHAIKVEESSLDRSIDLESRINDLEVAICELAEALME